MGWWKLENTESDQIGDGPLDVLGDAFAGVFNGLAMTIWLFSGLAVQAPMRTLDGLRLDVRSLLAVSF